MPGEIPGEMPGEMPGGARGLRPGSSTIRREIPEGRVRGVGARWERAPRRRRAPRAGRSFAVLTNEGVDCGCVVGVDAGVDGCVYGAQLSGFGGRVCSLASLSSVERW